MIQLSQINEFQQDEAHNRFFQCCASSRWAEEMVKARPFENTTDLLNKAETLWNSLQEEDWLEAFEGHPQIGDMSSLRKKYANTSGWSSQEQSGVDGSSEENLLDLS
ncbi:OHCU decarboxylase, partial [bacterium]|nr:OHCU decarboxylase [bacterium]